MSAPTLNRADRLRDEFESHLKAARDIAEPAVDRDFTDDERTRLTDAMGKAKEAKTAWDAAKSDDRTRAAMRELGDGLGEPGIKRTPSGLALPSGQSIGQHFVGSEAYKTVLATAPGGHFTKDHRVEARPVGYERLLPNSRGQKTLVTGLSDTSGGAFVQSDWLGMQVGLTPFMRPLMLRDLVTNGTTTSDTVEYMRVTGITSNAAPVAEATATTGASGEKPESALATAKVTTPVRTIAHWIPITKRAMSDASQILTLIDQFLLFGLEEVVDDQMIAGDGTGENLEGLATVSGVQAQSAITGNLLGTLRQAKTKVRLGGRARPSAYIMHPTDVEALDVLADNENRFYFGGPGSSSVGQAGDGPTLWGLPVLESEALTAGTAYVGDWSKAVLWDREQAAITMSDSHLGFFTRNMVAILAELRVAFGVLQPTAFVEITLP